MQVVGVFLLLASIFTIWCGTQSFNPLGLFLAIMQTPNDAQGVVNKARQEVSDTEAAVNGSAENAVANTAFNSITGGAFGSGSQPFTPTNGSVVPSVLQSQQNTDQAKQAYQNYAYAQLQSKYNMNAQAQMPYLIKLWNQESGWNPKAKNASSGAFGIVQSLPASKLPNGENSTAQQQIDWGLGYIVQRYGSPQAAWAHEVANNWY